MDALLVGPGADLRWLIGYDALALERLTLLVVPAAGRASLIVPALEAPRAEASGATEHVELVTWDEREDPVPRVAALLPDARVVAVQDRLWTVFTLRLQEALSASEWVPGSQVVGPLRVRKEPDEVAALRAAGRAIDAVHAEVPRLLRPGRTEAAVGRDIAELIRTEHDEVAFVIVASGPNGASPHHDTGGRELRTGDAVVVDIGGVKDGYCSDMTRNYVLGKPPEGYTEVHEVLQQAQHAAVSAVAPGVAAEEVDATARRVLDDAGLVEYFVHRTGHGIGVEEHEPPWIVAGNEQVLEPGMAFSVEPGVYVPGRYGARIEDIVVVTDGGCERLNHRSHDLTVIATGGGDDG